jgi:branched-chain amino acid transport system ATP-binding protein
MNGSHDENGVAGLGEGRGEGGRDMASRGARSPMLALRALEVRYGGIRAVRGVDLQVDPGECVCLIGANGAGKSSTLRAICGLVPVAGGDVVYLDQRINGTPTHRLSRQGLVMVPEGRGIFGQLTIQENLAMGAYARHDDEAVRQDTERVFTLFPRLAERRRQAAGTLSGGEQQMLAMGRAMMARPRLLLLDEPSMGLAPLMVDRIFEIVRRIAEEGVTILLIEQNARLALEQSDRGYVMDSGQIILAGPSPALLHDPKVREAYLGEVAA